MLSIKVHGFGHLFGGMFTQNDLLCLLHLSFSVYSNGFLDQIFFCFP